ncbi:MAG: DUF3526 domain-containing protein [Rhodospirillaceae bacterium]|nr:DUF3526 domain-containing protein [Rhodospirillaceae bacterium]
MFGIVLGQELKGLVANRTWWGILGLLVVLTVLAAANGAARFAQMAEVAKRLNQDELVVQQGMKAGAARYEANPVGDPPSVTSPGNVGLSILGHYAVKSFGPLAALSVGQSDVQPSYYRVTAHPAHTFLNASEIQNPLTQVAGSFDVAFVFIFVLPILIIAVSFDLMSREKEGGTLSLLAAQGVPLRSLILAKIAARAGMILLVLLVLVFVAGAIVGADLGDAAELGQLALVYAVVAAYAFFWFALALLINALDWPSVTNGVVLANLWLVFVVVLPSFVNIAASMLYPAPSRVELTTEMREATEIADKEAAESRDAYLFDHPELAGAGANIDAFYIQVLATDAAVEKVVMPILAKFDQQAQSREKVVGLLQYASPAIAAQEALNAIAGTGNARFTDFVGQVLAFHDNWRGFFTAKIIKGERMTAADFDAIPAFGYTAPPFTAAAAVAVGPLVALALAVIVLVAWAARRYARYPVI